MPRERGQSSLSVNSVSFSIFSIRSVVSQDDAVAALKLDDIAFLGKPVIRFLIEL